MRSLGSMNGKQKQYYNMFVVVLLCNKKLGVEIL